jgi:uncharacterized RDD family membrane protein YckC
MKSITELTESRWRTTYNINEYGERERDREEFIAIRPVKSISSGPRFAHLIIDFIAFQLVIVVISYFFEIFINLTKSNVVLNLSIGLIGTLVLFLLYPGLYVLCEYMWQKTPGKYLTKTVVIDEYANKPEFRAIVLRSLIRLVPFEPLSCYQDKYSNCWHDRWSKTWVVPEEEVIELKRLLVEQAEN